jgi:TetR/AcrR family transcriptional regulator, regulator of biofilm formation and stress response
MGRRRYDPERRRRIVDAAIRVVARDGIAGLSHRRVAAEADVPLGSTTYHFASRDDLLEVALRQVTEEWLAGVDHWERSIDPTLPFADELLRLIEETLIDNRERAELEYELYLAALNHEAVRPLAAECLDGLTSRLRRRVPDDASARALTAVLDGLMLQVLLTGRPLERDAMRGALARITGDT